MAPHPGINTHHIQEKARKDLLDLLEGVCKARRPIYQTHADAKFFQVRGKKNLVIEKSLAGPIGVFVKFSTLQDHGVDKVFFLENDNVDASQKNVIFLARGEKANQPIAVAGMYVLDLLFWCFIYFLVSILQYMYLTIPGGFVAWGGS